MAIQININNTPAATYRTLSEETRTIPIKNWLKQCNFKLSICHREIVDL